MLQKSYSDNYSDKATKNLHQNDPKAQPIVGAFMQLYYFIVGAGAIPVRLLFRENMGERSLTSMSLVVSLGLHIWYVYEYILLFGLGGSFAIFSGASLDSISNFDTGAIILAVIFNAFNLYLFEVFYTKSKKHFRSIVEFGKKNIVGKSSYYRGNGKYFEHYIGKEIKTIMGKFTVDEQVLRMIVEPRRVFYGGLLMALASIFTSLLIGYYSSTIFFKAIALFIFSFSAVGVLISLSAICLFLEEIGIYTRVRNAALDLVDGEEDLKLIMDTKEKFVLETNDKNASQSISENYPTVRIYKGK